MRYLFFSSLRFPPFSPEDLLFPLNVSSSLLAIVRAGNQ